MTSLSRDLVAIVRPSGSRAIAGVIALMVFQAIVQTVAVFSLIPLLSAAADMAKFRASQIGQVFVEAVGGGSDQKVLLWAGAISMFILIAGNGIGLAAEYVRARFAYGVAHRLRVQLFSDLLDRRYEYFTQVNASLLLKNLVDDTSTVAGLLISPALDVIARSLLVVLLVAAVFAVEPLIVLGGAGVMILYYLVVMKPVRRAAVASSDTMKEVVRGLYFEVYQTLNGVKPIIATGRKAKFIARASRISSQLADEAPRIPMYSAIPRSGLEVLVFGGMISWLLVALVSGTDLVTLLPRLGLVTVVAYRLMPSLQLLVAQFGAMSAARQSIEEISGLMQEQASLSAVAPGERIATLAEPLSWSHEICFQDVGFTYAGATDPAIAGVSFTIPKGSRVAFVGPTGSGKSTLIDLLLGMLEPTQGLILVDGQPLDQSAMPAWRRAVGYVPQELFLLDGSIAENIAFGFGSDELDHARVEAVADVAQAREFIEDGRSDGFDARVGERGVRLSGGQRQRLALARALYGRPNILVLDEATSALDPATERNVVAALADGHDQLTVVTVTHRLGTVRDYDCIHYVEHGRIVASGDFASLAKFHDSFGAMAH
jgi:ABC-type multidrug transport system fused ATPase/permease subunit